MNQVAYPLTLTIDDWHFWVSSPFLEVTLYSWVGFYYQLSYTVFFLLVSIILAVFEHEESFFIISHSNSRHCRFKFSGFGYFLFVFGLRKVFPYHHRLDNFACLCITESFQEDSLNAHNFGIFLKHCNTFFRLRNFIFTESFHKKFNISRFLFLRDTLIVDHSFGALPP